MRPARFLETCQVWASCDVGLSMNLLSLTDALDEIGLAVQQWSRPGEQWPQGPVGEQAGSPAALTDYVALLAELETAVLDGPPVVHRALRRLHYSSHVRRTGGRRRGIRLEALLSGDETEYPLIWTSEPPAISQPLLDGLFSTTYLAPPTSAALDVAVDLGAVFTGSDALFTGASDLAAAGEVITGVSSEGMVGWAGDLAAWLLAWEERRQQAEAAGQPWTPQQARQQLDETQREEAPLELMLGNFDGQALAGYLRAEVAEQYDFDTAPALADMFESYYGQSPPADDNLPHISRRFELFVPAAEPGLPHTVFGEQVLLDSDAAAVVESYITDLAAFFLFQGRRDKRFGKVVGTMARSRPPRPMTEVRAEVAAQAATIQEIAGRFVELLHTGLENGQAPAAWPRQSE